MVQDVVHMDTGEITLDVLGIHRILCCPSATQRVLTYTGSVRYIPRHRALK